MSEADDIKEFMGLVGKGQDPLQELIKALSPKEYRRYLHIVKVDEHNRKVWFPSRSLPSIGNKGPSK